jgi:hypothetical protein
LHHPERATGRPDEHRDVGKGKLDHGSTWKPPARHASAWLWLVFAHH